MDMLEMDKLWLLQANYALKGFMINPLIYGLSATQISRATA
jgi:hypothetical protein